MWTSNITGLSGVGSVLPTDPEIRGDLLHFFHEVGAEVLDIFQIILHGEGQVHKIVQVNGVILSTFEFQLESLRFTFTEKKSGYLVSLKSVTPQRS